MDNQFVFLAVVGVLTLVFAFLAAAQGFGFETVDVTVQAPWEICGSEVSAAQVRDCELRQALVDANLMEAG